jgi:hypothetical protein
MKAVSLRQACAAAALIVLTPAAAVAQEDVRERAEDIAKQANDVQRQAGALANDVANSQVVRDDRGTLDPRDDRVAAVEDDDDGFDWGLLGLLGLIGLAGLKGRDTNRVDRVDTIHREPRL